MARVRRKVAVGGEGGVGKTTICRRLTDRFSVGGSSMTIGVDFFVLEGEGKELIVYDLAGQRRFFHLHRGLVSGATVGMLVFDLSRPSTLYSLGRWAEVMREAGVKEIILVGNKLDLPTRVSREEAEAEAAELGAKRVIFTSALDGRGIEELRRALEEVVSGSDG